MFLFNILNIFISIRSCSISKDVDETLKDNLQNYYKNLFDQFNVNIAQYVDVFKKHESENNKEMKRRKDLKNFYTKIKNFLKIELNLKKCNNYENQQFAEENLTLINDYYNILNERGTFESDPQIKIHFENFLKFFQQYWKYRKYHFSDNIDQYSLEELKSK